LLLSGQLCYLCFAFQAKQTPAPSFLSRFAEFIVAHTGMAEPAKKTAKPAKAPTATAGKNPAGNPPPDNAPPAAAAAAVDTSLDPVSSVPLASSSSAASARPAATSVIVNALVSDSGPVPGAGVSPGIGPANGRQGGGGGVDRAAAAQLLQTLLDMLVSAGPNAADAPPPPYPASRLDSQQVPGVPQLAGGPAAPAGGPAGHAGGGGGGGGGGGDSESSEASDDDEADPVLRGGVVVAPPPAAAAAAGGALPQSATGPDWPHPKRLQQTYLQAAPCPADLPVEMDLHEGAREHAEQDAANTKAAVKWLTLARPAMVRSELPPPLDALLLPKTKKKAVAGRELALVGADARAEVKTSLAPLHTNLAAALRLALGLLACSQADAWPSAQATDELLAALAAQLASSLVTIDMRWTALQIEHRAGSKEHRDRLAAEYATLTGAVANRVAEDRWQALNQRALDAAAERALQATVGQGGSASAAAIRHVGFQSSSPSLRPAKNRLPPQRHSASSASDNRPPRAPRARTTPNANGNNGNNNNNNSYVAGPREAGGRKF
jgi:hypothetical protein